MRLIINLLPHTRPGTRDKPIAWSQARHNHAGRIYRWIPRFSPIMRGIHNTDIRPLAPRSHPQTSTQQMIKRQIDEMRALT